METVKKKRKKLTKLIEKGHGYYYSEEYKGSNTYEAIAEYLIQNGVTIQEWVSVDERLPITEKEAMEYYEINSEFPQFIVKIDVGVAAMVLEFNGKDWFDGYATYNVTHWAPLPEPPKEK